MGGLQFAKYAGGIFKTRYRLSKTVCKGDGESHAENLGGWVSDLTVLGLIIVSLKFELASILWYNMLINIKQCLSG